MVALVWRASASASVQASLSLPIASFQPCILVLALVPVCACLGAALLLPATTGAPPVPATV